MTTGNAEKLDFTKRERKRLTGTHSKRWSMHKRNDVSAHCSGEATSRLTEHRTSSEKWIVCIVCDLIGETTMLTTAHGQRMKQSQANDTQCTGSPNRKMKKKMGKKRRIHDALCSISVVLWLFFRAISWFICVAWMIHDSLFDCCVSFSRPIFKTNYRLFRLLSAQMSKTALNVFIYDGHFDARKSPNSLDFFVVHFWCWPIQPLHLIISLIVITVANPLSFISAAAAAFRLDSIFDFAQTEFRLREWMAFIVNVIST